MSRFPGKPYRTVVVAWIAVLLLASACTSSSSSTPEAVATKASPAASETTFPGRLLVTEDGKGVRTMRPDGSGVSVVSGTQDAVVSQPIWSPDATKIAWAQTAGPPQTVTLSFETAASAQAAGQSSIVIANADGSGRESAPTGTGVIYTSWDPTSARVAFLGNAKSGLELGTVSAGSNHATALDHGSPFYFSWSPDGKQLLAHIGGALDDVSLADGSHVPVAVPGQFEAPFWGSNSQMFIARQAAGCGGACLVTQSGSSVTAQMIAPVPESGADFSPNAAFDAVAIGTRAPTTQGTLGGSLEVARRNGSRWATTQITDQPPVVFYWSPDGSKLLFATLEQASSGPWLHWNVWDGSHTVTYGRFRPGEVFARSYLPFFTQYAQSMSLWAPDGSAFAYPGIDESGQPGIWVQPADDSSAAPTMVSSGDVVTWSPK